MDISVVIVNYKTPKLLIQCLESLFHWNPTIHDVIVVDNNSQDKSITEVREKFPTVKTVASTTNAGYAVGVNWGMNYAKHDTILILNPDVEVLEGSVQRMYDVLYSEKNIGIVAPKLLNLDGSLQYSCLEFYHLMTPLYRRTPLGETPFGRKELNRFQMIEWDHNQMRDIGWAIGAALMIKRELVDKIGELDERFFLYYEDVDFCRRAWNAGYRVVYVPDAILKHEHKRLSALHAGFSSLFNAVTRIHMHSWLKYLWKYRGQLAVPLSVKENAWKK